MLNVSVQLVDLICINVFKGKEYTFRNDNFFFQIILSPSEKGSILKGKKKKKKKKLAPIESKFIPFGEEIFSD